MVVSNTYKKSLESIEKLVQVSSQDLLAGAYFQGQISALESAIDAKGQGSLRVHYIDSGRPDAEPILLMHGNPTWVYLYRKMIPGLLTTGRRVIAVDLIGCGRSDKPAKRKYYTQTQARHIDWMRKWGTDSVEWKILNKSFRLLRDWSVGWDLDK